MGNYKLYQGDCLEVMKSIEDGSVDLVVTDPPPIFAIIQDTIIKADFQKRLPMMKIQIKMKK